MISVGLATNAGSALTSTAAQIVAAINANPSASALVTAETYRGDAGASVAAATPIHALSDFLAAPGTVARDPFQQRLLRVGAHRDGTRVGVFVFAQADGRQLVAPLVAIELVERLLRNYGTDPATTALLDELELFVVPNANPDGANFALYDASTQSKTLVNRCGVGTSNDPLARTTWGVALERNFSVGSIFDGYFGGSTICTSTAFSGPFELSEPETRNIAWVASTFPNIRFSVDLQANGGYLTWSPGAYLDNGSRAHPAEPVGDLRRLHGRDRRPCRGQPRPAPRPHDPAPAHGAADRRDVLGGRQRDRPAHLQHRPLRPRAGRRAGPRARRRRA